MTRWGLATLGAILVLGAAGVLLARALGLSGSRASALVSVASQWIAAWVLWTFAAGLATQAGVVSAYEPAFFGAVAVAGSVVQYRALVAGRPDRARTVFVGTQLAWLVVVLARNGLLQ